MKSKWLLGGLAWLAAASVWAQNPGRESPLPAVPRSAGPLAKDVVLNPPGAATVKQESLYVRSQPDFAGDVLAHVHNGDTVTVLEQITLAKPKLNEPANWARIALPTNAGVWVFANYVDTNAMTISRARVNVRGGPSDNFTIVARLEKGAPVKVVRRAQDWIQIEPPTNAYGFVAADYLTMEPVAAAPPAAVAAAEPVVAAPSVAVPVTAPPVTNTPVPVVATPEPATPAAVPPPATNMVAETTNTPPAAAVTTPIVAPEPVVTAPPPTPIMPPTNTVVPPAAEPVVAAPVAAVPPPTASTPALEPMTAETKPRIVMREGYIRKAINVQAPADYELHDVNSGKIIEYIQPDPKDKKFKKYDGTRVLVSGSEWVDRRWPKTPILKVETVDLVP